MPRTKKLVRPGRKHATNAPPRELKLKVPELSKPHVNSAAGSEQTTPTASTRLEKIESLRKKADEMANKLAEEILKEVDGKVKELSLLGYEYKVVLVRSSQNTAIRKGRPAGTSSRTKDPSSNIKPDTFCPICRITGHTIRAHNFHKEAFTEEELKEKRIVPTAAQPEHKPHAGSISLI